MNASDRNTAYSFPDAPVTLVPPPSELFPWQWRVVRCPFCGDEGTHMHSGGHLHYDPTEMLGTRKVHCSGAVGDDKSYILVDADPAYTKILLEKHNVYQRTAKRLFDERKARKAAVEQKK